MRLRGGGRGRGAQTKNKKNKKNVKDETEFCIEIQKNFFIQLLSFEKRQKQTKKQTKKH